MDELEKGKFTVSRTRYSSDGENREDFLWRDRWDYRLFWRRWLECSYDDGNRWNTLQSKKKGSMIIMTRRTCRKASISFTRWIRWPLNSGFFPLFQKSERTGLQQLDVLYHGTWLLNSPIHYLRMGREPIIVLTATFHTISWLLWTGTPVRTPVSCLSRGV